MLTLINTNRMTPPIAPIGLDHLAAAVQEAGCGVDLLDLCFAEEPGTAVSDYFSSHHPNLVGLSLRNVDDCFLAGSAWFVPDLRESVDSRTYFRLGGQIGLETTRGCNRRCIYCPEPRIKGSVCRSQDPRLVADEVQSLLRQGIDVLHLWARRDAWGSTLPAIRGR